MRLKLLGIVVLMLLAFGVNVPSNAFGIQTEESQLKAVFVLNFAKLTEWPADSRVDSKIFTIAVLGKAPSDTFIKTLQSQTVRGAKVSVRLISEADETKGARLVYIDGSERHRLTRILKGISHQGILTVSDISGFCEAGGMIGLEPLEDRLSFVVNVAAVRKAGLTVSSQLLKLAKTVLGN
jgi:hypothetical protein